MNSFIPNTLQGVPVTISEPLKVEVKVKRNWFERLLTVPFNPFAKYRVTYEWQDSLKDGDIIKSNTGLYMNRKTFNDCENALLKGGKEKPFNTYKI